ncbi:hypothetical protein U9M48_002779 [Paspalum notatum var. saurae]|uniref:Reverse transcriptase zinc-binding domain-containing protein n=1 Tax=Paspalum notatum var. saurae TaxID=547442 RepID=A0AAQ3PI88_PASNO
MNWLQKLRLFNWTTNMIPSIGHSPKRGAFSVQTMYRYLTNVFTPKFVWGQVQSYGLFGYVIFNATYWARFLSLLQKANNSPFMKWACWVLETMSIEGTTIRKKYRLSKWDILCLPKDQGGLGILNLEIQNKCLLSKWLFKLLNEDGMWQQLLRKKYIKDKTIGEVQWKPGDSHFWSGLMNVKDCFLSIATFNVHSGTQCRFWEDRWLGKFALKDQFLSLYNIARKKHILVANVVSATPLNISFRRALVGDNLLKWNDLVAKVAFVQLDNYNDSIHWTLSKHGFFSVQSMYKFFVNQMALPLNKSLWKLRLPLKIKILNWLVHKESFLLDSFLELTTEREEQANLEVGVSSARNYGHGDFRQAWMIYSFGKGTTIRKKYRPIAWDIICLPKDRGVRNLEFRNTK